MLRKQKSKILMFLLMLGILYGCKRQILDPLNPQNNLPSKVQLDKVKGFYEKGRYKNQPKRTSSNGNERMTVADSARFKDFEPQWDKTEVELLPNNEKMLIVPVIRFLSVNYNKEIGFIRRLCIRVDENDDFLEANIVEIIGNLNFVKSNHNTIFKSYKENNITGFKGYVIVYELDYDQVVYRAFNNGFGVITTNGLVMDTQPWDCFEFYIDGDLIFSICIPSGGGGGGSGSGSDGGGYGGGSGSDGGGGSGGGYGGSGGGGSGGTNNPPVVVTIPVVIPIPPMPSPGMVYDYEMGVWVFPPRDPSVSWEGEGWGDGVPRDELDKDIDKLY